MIIRLAELEKLMKPQFILDRVSTRVMQTSEEHEGNKELARMIFVGIADMYGFESAQITDYLDMGYDSYRNKLSNFREYYKECLARIEAEQPIRRFDPQLRKFYCKVCLCLNSIKYNTKTNPYYTLNEHLL